ncbi:MAG: hypothetical protein HOP33_12520 [Verrucomicrobia bacterium]|nr:hypothetical protein [Verrucomicrobiota bacterium]
MNSGNQPDAGNGNASAGSFSVDDVLYTVFRHWRLIVIFTLIGVAGAVAVRFVKPPMYVSKAMISVRFVQDVLGTDITDPEKLVRSTISSVQSIMDTEVENIKSFDTACAVATNFGPARILAKRGGGNDPMAAAAEIASGISVEPPRTATITITFRHPDETIVQPVMTEIIKTYKRRHLAMRQMVGLDEVITVSLEEKRQKLSVTENELKKVMTDAGIVELGDSIKGELQRINETEKELSDAELELTKRRARLGEMASSSTNTSAVVPSETAEEYAKICSRLALFTRSKENEILDNKTEQHPRVVSIQGMIDIITRQKKELERVYPALALSYVGNNESAGRGTNSFSTDLASEMAEIKRLTYTVDALKTMLSNKQASAFRIKELEPRIVDLQRRRDDELKGYTAIRNALESAKSGAKSTGDLGSIYDLQLPSPPGLDSKKLMKLMGGVFGGCVGLGLGIAFLIDMFLVRTIRRTSDVKRAMHMPVFLSIPDALWSKKKLLPSPGSNGNSTSRTVAVVEGKSKEQKEPKEQDAKLALAPWRPDHHLQSQIEGLRERVITYFEVHNLNHKPKLVALTACDEGAGVTTLAAGLAAALSRTGDGSVLLVDINAGSSFAFYKGNAGCGPSVKMKSDHETANEKVLSSEMSLATIKPEDDRWERISKILPSDFNDLFPNLNAKEYDYIVFDMATVSPASVTPRMAGHMDLVLMILECEKTGQMAARQAANLMRESRANVVAVMNKLRSYVPAGLSHE